MALERISHAALAVIPEEHQFLMHSMYEDSDLEGARQAEALFDFIEQEHPGHFVGILANDSVTPPCCNAEGHYNCDFYEPDWYTVLVPASTWKEYQGAVWAKDQEWKQAHGCKEGKQGVESIPDPFLPDLPEEEEVQPTQTK